MKIEDFYSVCSPELNAKILRVIENLVCRYGKSLPDGWRCCIEFQRENEEEPYYMLDLKSNRGGGDLAPIKMETLKIFPEICGSGVNNDPSTVADALMKYRNLPCPGLSAGLYDKLSCLHDFKSVSDETLLELAELGFTLWHGGIRIPYDILVTDIRRAQQLDEDLDDVYEQSVEQTRGEIRITFSGAKEWQDVFFCFCIFERIQGILNELWPKDQIWYNLRGFENDNMLQFWVEALGITEAPEN